MNTNVKFGLVGFFFFVIVNDKIFMCVNCDMIAIKMNH